MNNPMPDSTVGGRFSILPDDMTEVARKLSRDSADFEMWVAPVRSRLTGNPGAGWKSAGAFGLYGAVTKQRETMRTADTLLEIVTRDLENMSRTTRALTNTFVGTDALNEADLEAIRTAANLPAPPGMDSLVDGDDR